MPDVDSKVCTGCKLDLPFSEYYKQKAGKHGLRAKCKVCSRKRNREHYAANRYKIVARTREYRRANSDKHREWLEANRERIAAHNREYYAANRDKVAARTRDWKKANPHKRRECRHRRRARILEATVVQFPPEKLLERMGYFGNKCYMCGGPFEHVDHVKPISKGGPHMLSNLRPACQSCNLAKGNKWPLAAIATA